MYLIHTASHKSYKCRIQNTTQTNISTQQKQIHRRWEQICGPQWEGGELGKDWEFGISRCKLLYTGWINKVPLYSTGNYTQYPVTKHNGNEYEKECLCIYLCITESLCYTAETVKFVNQSNVNKTFKEEIVQYFDHLMWRANSLEKILMLGKIEGRRSRWQRMRWLGGITGSMNMSPDMILSKLQEMVKDRKPGVLQPVGL